MITIGIAEVDITPPLGTRMSEPAYEDRHATGILDPLFARAMVIDNGTDQLCFVTCDVLSVRRSTVVNARQAIQEQTGIPTDRVAISATHTHWGPATTFAWTHDLVPDEDYIATFEKKIAEAACTAFENRQPATIGFAWRFEGKLTFNRRFIMRDGNVLMHPTPGSTDILYQEGPVDPEVGIVCARDANGKTLGYIVNYACHATASFNETGEQITADFPGHLAAKAKQVKGDDCITLFTNGACANLCQQDVYDPDHSRFGEELATMIGEKLAEHAFAAEEDMEWLDDLPLDARSTEIPFPIRPLPDKLLEWAREVKANPDAYSMRDKLYANSTFELAEEKRHSPMTIGEVQAFRIGDIGWVMLPGEIFVEFGLDIKLRSPAERTWVTGLANGIVGYVPTKRAFEDGAGEDDSLRRAWGNYEQRTANTSRLAHAAGEMMVETGHALLDSMFR